MRRIKDSLGNPENFQAGVLSDRLAHNKVTGEAQLGHGTGDLSGSRKERRGGRGKAHHSGRPAMLSKLTYRLRVAGFLYEFTMGFAEDENSGRIRST